MAHDPPTLSPEQRDLYDRMQAELEAAEQEDRLQRAIDSPQPEGTTFATRAADHLVDAIPFPPVPTPPWWPSTAPAVAPDTLTTAILGRIAELQQERELPTMAQILKVFEPLVRRELYYLTRWGLVTPLVGSRGRTPYTHLTEAGAERLRVVLTGEEQEEASWNRNG